MQFTFPMGITNDPRAGALATINTRRLSHEPKNRARMEKERYETERID